MKGGLTRGWVCGDEAGVKKQTHSVASVRSQFSVLRQICNLIPNHLVPRLARETGAAALCRTFSAWSHCVALLFAQFTHALGLLDIADGAIVDVGGIGPSPALLAETPLASDASAPKIVIPAVPRFARSIVDRSAGPPKIK